MEPSKTTFLGIASMTSTGYISRVELTTPLAEVSITWNLTSTGDKGVSMLRNMFKSKIHRATVTHADIDYEGSVTIDADLLKAANLRVYEHVHVWNITNGNRIETYVLEGAPGSGVICINGAAAHQNSPGDIVIISSFASYEESELRKFEPTVVLVDRDNKIVNPTYAETPGPLKAV